MTPLRGLALGAGLAAALTLPAAAAPAPEASPPVHLTILVPSNDNCGAYVTAVNSGDTAAMLNLGGWALGYWSALAEQSGKDILHAKTSEALLDRLATDCQNQPNTPMSSIVEMIGRGLLAGLPE